jgi:hypothetical protein
MLHAFYRRKAMAGALVGKAEHCGFDQHFSPMNRASLAYFRDQTLVWSTRQTNAQKLAA